MSLDLGKLDDEEATNLACLVARLGRGSPPLVRFYGRALLYGLLGKLADMAGEPEVAQRIYARSVESDRRTRARLGLTTFIDEEDKPPTK